MSAETHKPSIFLFHGADSYTASTKLSTWKKGFVQKYGNDFNISELDGKNLSISQFKVETESMPFGSEKRMIIIKNFLSEGKKEEQKDIADILKNLPTHAITIFFEAQTFDKRSSLYKQLQKLATTEEFKPLEGYELQQWVNRKFAQKNTAITAEATQLLISQIANGNLWQLNNDIEKISLFTHNRQVSAEDIKALTNANFTDSIFTLTDSIAHKKPKNSLDIFHHLVSSGEDIPRIFYMLVRHFRILIQTKDLLDNKFDQKEIATKLKLHPFVIKNAATQSRNFSFPILVKIYRNLLSIEIGLKSGKIKLTVDDKRDLILAIEKMFMNLCR